VTRRTILFVQPANAAAYPPLLNAGALFAEAGWRVVFLSAPFAGLAIDFPDDAQFEVHSFPPRPSHAWGKADYGRYCWHAVLKARAVKPDLVYASDPVGALPGLLAAGSVGARLIYHEHDSPTQLSELNPVVRAARRRAMASAHQVVFPNAQRAERCLSQLGLPPSRATVVWNTPRRSEVVPSTEPQTGPVVVYYHGSITPARLPPSAVQAVARFAGKATLRIVGYEVPSAIDYVAGLTKQYGAAQAGGLIDWQGEVDRAEIISQAAKADLGLSLMPMQSDDINAVCMAGASNKIFDYMAAGLPSVVSALPDWQDTFVRPGHALDVTADSADSIANALSRLMDQPGLRAEMGRRNRARILADWNYETSFAPVLEAACR
jgi:glycosyltransferase involved in cell wall biosynthesis